MGRRKDKEVFQLGDIFKVNVTGIIDGSGVRNGKKKEKKRVMTRIFDLSNRVGGSAF